MQNIVKAELNMCMVITLSICMEGSTLNCRLLTLPDLNKKAHHTAMWSFDKYSSFLKYQNFAWLISAIPFIQSCTYLTPAAPLVAIIDSCQVVSNGIPIHDPSTLVGATNSGLLLQEEVEVNTRMRNWSGTLLRGMVELVEAKSSICNATAYQPVLPVAKYWSVH